MTTGRRLLIPVLAGLAGIGFSLAASHIIAERQRLYAQSQFNQSARNQTQAVSQSLAAQMLILESIESLYGVSEEVSRKTFGDFVQPFLKNVHGIQALEWIPRIPHDERGVYEQAARQDGLEDFHITVRRLQGQMQPAPICREYFPVYYVEPLQGNKAAVGFDLASDPVRKMALEHSCDQATAAATARIRLVQENQEQYGFLLFLPVYAGGMTPETQSQRQKLLKGFVLGVYRIMDIIDHALDFLQENTITLAAYDLSASHEERFLHVHNGLQENPDAVWDGSGEPFVFNGIEPLKDQLTIGGRKWSLVCMPTSRFQPGYHRIGWIVLFGGVILSILSAAYLANLSRRAQRLECLVASRAAALQAHERRLRVVIETIPEPVWLKDLEGVYLACNPKFERFFGAKEKDIIGKTDYDFVDREQADFFRLNDKKAIAAGQPVMNEEEIVYADDGHRERIETIKTVLLDENGKAAGVLGIARDITERQNMQRQLEENRTNLRSFFDSVENLLSVMDMQGTIIEVNESLRRKLGYSGKELIGKNILDLHPEQYHQQAKETVRQMAEGKIKTCPLPLIAKDGHHIPAETYVVKGCWNGQEAIFGVSKDISELKESEEKFAKAFRSSAALMAISTIEGGRFIEVNECFLQTLGYRKEEVIGKTSTELGLFVNLNQREEVKQRIQKQGFARDCELQICTKQGEVLDALFNADMLVLQDNQYFLTVANNITELRKSQNELRKAHDTLEEKVQQRTEQLQKSQQQLRELYSRLQTVQEQERKQISREIHDELGTVLTGFKYDLAWVQRKLANPSAVITEKINAMSAAVDAIIETVQQICAQLRPGLLDDMGLAAAMEWQAEKFAAMGGFASETKLDKNIDIHQECSTALFRIFQELLTNILRHAKAGKIEVSLTQQNSNVLLEVRDNGVGITQKQISDNNSLGLIGIRERVTIYGGTFEIKGSPEKGTIATVTIPVEKGLDHDKNIDM